MRDKTILINALRAAADIAEEDDRSYFWMSMTRCNCGLVAQQILGAHNKAGRELLEARVRGVLLEAQSILGFDCGWEQVGIAIDRCASTGTPLFVLTQKLLDAGFEHSDFRHLEDLADRRVRERAGLKEEDLLEDREDREAFIRYARAWADILEEKALVDQAMGS